MKTLISTLMLGLGALASVAAAQDTQPPKPQRLPPAVTAEASRDALTVHNQRKAPVTIYADYGQFDRRLGIVPALGDVTLSLPRWAVEGRQKIRLFAHVEGEAADLSTHEFALAPPGRIGMVIPPREVLETAATDTMMAHLPSDVLDAATLTIDNPRDVPVTVFAEPGNYDVRLGLVPARSRVTLRFPKSVVGPGRSLKVFVHPEGGRDLSSEILHVAEGAHLGLRVPPR